jgi:hypothetical protein
MYIQHLKYRQEVVRTFQTKETISAITNINFFLQSLFLTSENDCLCNYHLSIVCLVTVLVADINKSFFHSRI